jgi:[acyl-carrier-protein] S-malonyltransferase
MGIDLRGANRRAAELFDLADQITGLEISRICAEGPLERLTRTDVAQPAVVAHSLAALAVLEAEIGAGWQLAAVAGHSVGELAAYVAGGALDAASALRVVHVRAQAMAEACRQVDGGMVAVMGLDEQNVRRVCQSVTAEGDGTVELANINAPGQLVISGQKSALQRASDQVKSAGARRVIPLNVGGPFHSVYMRPATEALEHALAEIQLQPAKVPIVANATAEVITHPEALERELAVQVASPVRWTESLHRLAELGCDRFLEVGPGQVLAGLAKRTLPDACVASFGGLGDVPAARSLLLDPAS